MVWVGQRSSPCTALTFPQANEYFDAELVSVLRTAYELYQRDDILSDLVGHFRGQADKAPTPTDAIYPRLALSSLLWWNDSRDEAIAELTRVVDASRAESELRLDLAELLEQERAFADALALLDEVQPLDNATLRRREDIALRVAVSSGNHDRARQAAQRLFGLRLDTDTQLRLSGQMNQLGLHEQADALLGRARRRAGNKAAALVGLMQQYQRQGKNDEATQVAMQLLRSSRGRRTGHLQPSTRHLDRQRPGSSPCSTTPTPTARQPWPCSPARGDYRSSSRDRSKSSRNRPTRCRSIRTWPTTTPPPASADKARAELEKLALLRPDDANLRLQVANQLARAGQTELALAHYKTVFKKDPTLAARSFAQIETMLLQARQI